MCTVGLRKNGSCGTMQEVEWRVLGGSWRTQLYGRRNAAKKFNEVVVAASDGLGIDQCPEQPSLFRRPGTTLIFECHDDFYVSGSNVELAGLQENLGARLKLKPAEPMGSGSQYSHLRATRTRVDADTIHIAPRETSRPFWTSWASATTSVNRCRPRQSKRTGRATKTSQDWVKKTDVL